MCIAVYGTAANCAEIQSYLRNIQIAYFDSTEELIPALFDNVFAAAIVAMGNAAGMEAVIALRKANRRLPVAWFSNDRNFAAQAYRLDIEYFTALPLSADKLGQALKRCGIQESTGA